MKEIEACLTDELDGVYRDYCLEVWTEVLNLTRVPAASKWRRAENVYYPQDLQEAPEAPLDPERDVAHATTTLEQLPITQASFTPPETSKEPGKVGDQGQGVEVAKGKEVA